MAEAHPGARPGGRTRLLLLAALLAAVTLGVFSGVTRNGFLHWDDQHYVTQNRYVQRGLDARSVRWAFRATRTDNWHPLTWLSHMLDVELFGLDPAGHHATSALLHALNGALLFLVLAAATRRPWAALLAAALFALHPLRVESVAWVSERKDLLAGLFWIAALGAHVAAVRAASPARRRAGRLLVALLLALGLLAKPVLVTLPLALLLLDAWPLGRLRSEGPGRLLLEKVPLLLLCAASAVVTVRVQRAGGAVSSLEAIPLGARTANAALSYVLYAGDFLWPTRTSFFHPHPFALDPQGFGWGDPRVLASAALLAAALALAWRTRRRAPYVAVGLSLYLVTALPMIGLVQVGMQGRADRYTYLPSIGLALALAYGLAALVHARPRLAAPVATLSAVALALLALATWRAVPTWRTSETLFASGVERDPQNYFARNLLGAELLERGEVDLAREQFEAALATRPGSLTALSGLGLCEMNRGRWEEAERWFRKAVRLRPSKPESRAYLGQALERLGRGEEAEEEFRHALEGRPGLGIALDGLGRLALVDGRPDEAARLFERALESDAGDAEARTGLAEARRLGAGGEH